jgi:membrane associated rhomboid family serine protease
MILLVPYKPEVPRYLAPRIWPGLVLVLLLGITFLEVKDTIEADRVYVDEVNSMVETDDRGNPTLKPEGHAYLQLRPLMKIAPAKGDWDFKRLLFANLLHGSSNHLYLNLVGTFAGARICSTFLTFPSIVFIFLAGGSLGLLLSMLLSTEVSAFIPHVGASAGIFALMGTYYIYNFGFRTRYFFWFPSRRAGIINLRTSWFFFLDVILMELVLSSAQFFPNKLGNVDHIAHVVGFLSGASIALILRSLQRWPSFLQTRGEFLYWKKILRPKGFDAKRAAYTLWLELLEINPYNDLVKGSVFRLLSAQAGELSDVEIQKAFRFLSPTYLRLHTDVSAKVIRSLLARGRALPEWWYKTTPYDSIIRIAKEMSQPVEEQYLLFELIEAYRKAHPEGGSVDRKLELLMSKLRGVIPEPKRRSPAAPAGNPGNAASSTTQPDTEPRSAPGTATKAS